MTDDSADAIMGTQPIVPGPILKGRFLGRPNRFLVRCHVDGVGSLDAFLPNPGRLWELLLPDAALYVTTDTGDRASSKRKTDYTVLAVERDGSPVFLHTHLTNRVARMLIESKRVPGLQDAEILRAEFAVGNSRFDFLLQRGRRQILLEVKSCTLFGNGVAMFPDAVTQRGRKHLVELAEHSEPGRRPCVLFVIHCPHVDWFMPDYHTDLAFSQTLIDVRRKLEIVPISIGWNPDLSIGRQVRKIEVPWSHLRHEVKDSGAYLLLLRLQRDRRLEIGRLGNLPFPRGYYLYVGSAMRNLSARITRHTRRRKTFHWHIDYLRNAASECTPLAIRSSGREECEIARSLAQRFPSGAEGFGSSDCDCPTHLFRHPDSPLSEASFHEILQQFRMKRPRESP